MPHYVFFKGKMFQDGVFSNCGCYLSSRTAFGNSCKKIVVKQKRQRHLTSA